MDDMELDGTPVQQPDDPFKGDASVTAEQPVQTEQPAQTEQVVQEQLVTAEAQPQPQPQPAAEAVAEEKPKWIKIVDLVALICISAAGLLAALFMCLMSVKVADVNYMLKDVADEINEAAKVIGELGADGDFAGYGEVVSSMFSNAYVLLAMVMGIVAGLVCGIIVIVKMIGQFALKKKTSLEKSAITSCLFFFAIAVIVLNMAMVFANISSMKISVEYGGATLAGLILCGILFAAYFICKIVTNYKSYLGDKTKLINGCFNLGWAVVAMIVLAVLACAPVVISGSQSGIKFTLGAGFNQTFAEAIGNLLDYGKEIPDSAADRVASLGILYGYSAVGMILQVWFIFQTGKSLHGAMRGTVAADKAVKLGSQIWRTVFAVLYLIVSVVVANEFDVLFPYYPIDFKPSLAAPIVILVFSVIGLVIAIVNKVIVKEKVEKHEI